MSAASAQADRAAVDTPTEAADCAAALVAPHAVVLCDNRTWRIWRGTREQLEEVGVYLRGPWPAEPWGKRWAVARDVLGLHTIVKPVTPGCSDLYEARVDLRSRPGLPAAMRRDDPGALGS